MVELMDILRGMQKKKPNAIEAMFSSHPMSEERYQTAAESVRTLYGDAAGYPMHRERYMDQTVALRAQKPVVEAIQAGDEAMMSKKWAQAETHYQTALKAGPDDYEALLKMAKCKVALNQPVEAKRYAMQARAVYPEEPQSLHMEGMTALGTKEFEQAATAFDAYGERLPGNPLPVFFAGLAYERMNRRPFAIARYRAFLQDVQEGDEAQHAYQRLVEWNVIARPATQGPG
jgi:tetratricopeptide (TPR) repeat protein